MRVLFLTNMPSPYRVDFFNELGKKCDLTVMFERERDRSRDERYKAGKYINFKALFPKGICAGNAEAFCPGVLILLSKEKYDHIIIGNYYSPTGMIAIEYMRWKKIPFIISSDGGIIKGDSKIRYRLKKHFIGSATRWLSTGKKTTEYLRYYGANEAKTFVYPFTSLWKRDILDKPLSLEKKKVIRQKLKIKEEKIVISVGQFIYRKGYDILLKACQKLDNTIGVYIIGGIPTEEYLKMKKKMNLFNVHFVDFMSKMELAEYYKAADLFVLPTREDIWGLVVNEAMAYGLPVVTTDHCVAGLELVRNGITGKIVPTEDAEALANAINNGNYSAEECLKVIDAYTIESMAEIHFKYFMRFNSDD